MTVASHRCVALGNEGERLVARLYGGTMTTHCHPVDVVTPRYAIEVKTLLHDAGTWRCSMSRRARRAKREWARSQDLVPITVLVILHPDHWDVYQGEGFKGFEYRWMVLRATVPLE